MEGKNSSRNSSYYLILGASLALTCIGLMMVFSASAVEQLSKDTSPFTLGIKQTVFAIVGFIAMLVLARFPAKWFKVLAWPGLAVSFVLLVLVLFIGHDAGGNKNWIVVSESFSFQPSEITKLMLILWMASVLSKKEPLLGQLRHLMIPVVPVAAVVVVLVLLEKDLGTSVIVMAIAAAALYFAGAPGKLFAGAALLGGIAALALALTSDNRLGRLTAWMGCGDANYNDVYGLCDQARNGMYALASGGWWGVGLGQGRQKWNWIPEAHNDFIFAIIGEEFGLLGTIVLILLYAVLAIAIFRVIVRHNDLFVRIVCGSVMTWILGQAFVNIAMVTGLLPVIGVPLPLVSYGGTSLTISLVAIGVVLSFARNLPDKAPKTKKRNTVTS
ncbi:putative lipid II flippase FtsW [Psychromicrobium lacuslunae]|uniref:putative lipid II flippase FtsW n=1 Tax=Psychromicrobium lacuslunae TaxID=1618207 RepID=UPI001F3A7AA8|nr:putative lipid II flippase FtsW [Psychromicrobium lacuslunae]